MQDSIFSIKIGQILPNYKAGIFSVNSEQPVQDAFKLMIEKKVLSLPLYDNTFRRFNKFIDMVDIVCFCMRNFQKKELVDLDLDYILESKEIFEKYKCGDICDLSGRNAWCPVESTAPLSVAIDLMVKWNVHRIPVIDSEGNLVSILTQSRILEYLHSFIDRLEGTSKTLEQMQIASNSIVSIRLDSLAIDAFKLIQEHSVSAIAVVNKIGILCGNISVSDMKMIGYDGKLLSRMFLPVESFMEFIPKNDSVKMFNSGVVAVTQESTLEEIIEKFHLSKVHRLYKVDKEGKPVQVVSQGDVLKYFTH
ncbi:CBS (cystathionine-beta-synthase) domain-containing protein [Tieghemostelium lacteum]|uniref:CBS (Cystathionine-beta-synthase) domain-containing protein n=1 Tax=Tieghemostelium lacteum TaxID=361077 RepID=A0A152A2S4_TIELA|nr:CBS (cystathionine-beta-synthase) domain-containing protein [Tieghemostelium lacteum]|eukprot:KYR00504.1 CBS (cystathionine-beta-synthase) domain-containing protein [Tieghemostelium lacteum]